MTASTGRPRLTLPLLGYALADILGLVLISLGGTWFINGRPLLFAFPDSTLTAGLSIGAGFVVMLWAVARLMVTMASQTMREPNPKHSGE